MILWDTMKLLKFNPDEIIFQEGDAATTLYVCVDILRISAQLLHPIMPSKTNLILGSIGMNASSNSLSFGKIKNGTKLNDNIGILFPKIEQEEL